MHPVGDQMLKGGEVRGALWFLVYGGWVRLFVKMHKDIPSVLNVRVYVLPDDVGRRYMDRNIESQSSKRLQLKKLILFLDLSAQAWAGDRTEQLTHAIRTLDKSKEKGPGDEDSLFYLFNTITLPAPTAAGVECQYSRQAMSSLLDSASKLGGLRTELYPYQRRSAATMIRREVKPARVLDPRLEPFEGPVGKNFYYDRETGILLRDRRTYEEARGGILAETMGLSPSDMVQPLWRKSRCLPFNRIRQDVDMSSRRSSHQSSLASCAAGVFPRPSYTDPRWDISRDGSRCYRPKSNTMEGFLPRALYGWRGS